MKGDISRQTFDARKHYSQVVMQQGRVQLDADWNEQQAIIQYRREREARDTIGPHGAPQTGGGFELLLLPDDRDLLITHGRIYVDGKLCELEAGTAVTALKRYADGVEVDHWTASWRVGQWLELLNEEMKPFEESARPRECYQISAIKDLGDRQLLTFYLEGDERRLSEEKRERVRFVRRVVTYCTQPDSPNPLYCKKSGDLPQLDLDESSLLLAYLDVWERHITAFDDPSLREVALEGPDTTTRLKTVWQVKLQPIALAEEIQDRLRDEMSLRAKTGKARDTAERENELKRLEDEIIYQLNNYGCDASTPEWQALIAQPTGRLNVTTSYKSIYKERNESAASEEDRDEELSGYQGLENQLYRVEVHGVEKATEITLKWAYNNASTLVYGLVERPLSGSRSAKPSVTILNTDQLNAQALAPYRYAEIVHPHSELFPERPQALLKIIGVEQDTLTLSSELEEGLVLLRLWNDQLQIPTNNLWKHLDRGIHVQCSPGSYTAGDYWLIPARTTTREVLWPPYEYPNRHPRPQARHGIQHAYCRLARLRWYKTERLARTSRDCRHIFKPLAEVVEAITVVNINWDQDALHKRALMREGLLITLSMEPEPLLLRAIEDDLLIITIEVQNPGGGTEGLFVVDGDCEVRGRTIRWHWDWQEKEGDLAKIFKEIDKLSNRFFATPKHFIRVRVRLKGHMIWRTVNGRTLYLDGQTFGVPGRELGPGRQREGRPRVDLRLPSGNGAKASDFESWFYIRE